jgi:hypothetical protein
MAEVWREAGEGFDWDTPAGRLGFHAFFDRQARDLGADAPAAAAGRALLEDWRSGAREPDAGVWGEARWRGPASGALDWLRQPSADGTPRAAKALLAARRDLRQRYGADPAGLVAWCLTAEAEAGRFAPDLLPQTTIDAFVRDPAALLPPASAARPGGAGDLRRRASAAFGVSLRAGWPPALAQALRAPFAAAAPPLPAPFIQLFADIHRSRTDLQRLFPLGSAAERFRFLRWLVGGGLAEYDVAFAALPPAVRRHPLMQLARLSVRARQPAPPRPAAGQISELWVVEHAAEGQVAAGRAVYEATGGRFLGPSGPVGAPARAQVVRFLTHPDLVAADAIALYARGVRWTRAIGVWDTATLTSVGEDSVGLGFVDEVSAP